MKLRFLCHARRHWLMQDAEATVHTLRQLQGIAGVALARADMDKAIRLAGSSLECAELLLLTHKRRDAASITAFRQSAELLASALETSGSRILACQVTGGSIATLQGLDSATDLSGPVYAACVELLQARHEQAQQDDHATTLPRRLGSGVQP